MASKRILFLTNSEYGQANVHLATAYELAMTCPDVEIHIGSFAELEGRVKEINVLLQKNSAEHAGPASTGNNKGIQFQQIGEFPSMNSAMAKIGIVWGRDAPHGYGFFKGQKSFDLLPTMLTAWLPEVYVGIYQKLCAMTDEIRPDLVVVDSLFGPGLDLMREHLAKSTKTKCVVLTPLDIAHGLPNCQPYSQHIWKTPVAGSAYPYPIPWSKFLQNIFLFVILIYKLAVDHRIHAYAKIRTKAGIKGLFPPFDPYKKEERYLLPGIPELDQPATVPSNADCCGPITMPCRPIKEEDHDLAAWLKKGRTVLISLGSHDESDGLNAIEIATALKSTMLDHPDVQVLWKTGKASTTAALDIIRTMPNHDSRVRMVRWLKTEPITILESGNVCCAIHHGGANSFFEACAAGVPQIVLPCWFDTYDFAQRTEYLGIGLWASRNSAPDVNAPELATALSKIVAADSQAEMRRAEAKRLAKVCHERGGRRHAAAVLIDVLGLKKLS